MPVPQSTDGVHLGFYCSNGQCKNDGGTIEGVRFECLTCESRDSFCIACFEDHPKEHKLVLHRYKCCDV
jgi:hypothetical protein